MENYDEENYNAEKYNDEKTLENAHLELEKNYQMVKNLLENGKPTIAQHKKNGKTNFVMKFDNGTLITVIIP